MFLSHLSHHPGLCGLSEFKGFPPPYGMVSIPVCNFADVNMNSYPLVIFCLFCVLFQIELAASNSSASSLPLLNSDWNNGMSTSSKPVTGMLSLKFV